MDVRLITKAGAEKRSADELPALLAAGEGLVWVDIPACDERPVRVLSEVFGFHPMAVRDCVERNRVPKMHAYSEHVFVVLHTPERGDRGHVHYVELDQFVGRNYLVTVHGPVNPAVDPEVAVRETRAVLDRILGGRLRPATPFELSFAIVSAMARNQEEYIEQVTSDVWRLEQQVTGGGTALDPRISGRAGVHGPGIDRALRGVQTPRLVVTGPVTGTRRGGGVHLRTRGR
jgi:Mg2+ and Co2+ transporter CorA